MFPHSPAPLTILNLVGIVHQIHPATIVAGKAPFQSPCTFTGRLLNTRTVRTVIRETCNLQDHCSPSPILHPIALQWSEQTERAHDPTE